MLVGICAHMRSQSYFREYIDSEENCDEFNNQVFTQNDSIYLINFISCDTSPYSTNILQFNLNGHLVKKLTIDDLIPNIYSGHLKEEELFIAGVNSNSIPDSKFVFWNGKLNLDSFDVFQMNLFETPTNVYLNSMGSVGMDSNKIVFGQFSLDNNPKVFSFLLWLKLDFSRDSLMIFDSTYNWSIISDAKIDNNNNLIILADAARIVDHIVYYYRILKIYNFNKEKVFEWISPPFGVNELASFTVLDTATIVLEFVAEDNANIHTLIAITNTGELVWEHIFHIDDPKSLYRINDIITCKDGNILCCGTYRNVSKNIIETGYICKLDKNGNVLWEKIFYDQEELNLPESGFNKVIHFNSIKESSDHSIVVGGRVIHNYVTTESHSDIFLAVLDSNGCISRNCNTLNDITSIGDFLSPEKTWIEGYEWNGNKWSYRYTFDTLPIDIDGKIYYELLRADSENSNNWNSAETFLRYENGLVFQNGFGGIENLIYNFKLNEGDTAFLGNELNLFEFVVVKLDTISLLNGDLKKRWALLPVNPVDPEINDTIIWIEDIGSLNGILSNFAPWTEDAEYSAILCVKWLDNIVYDNPIIDSCWIMTTSTNEFEMEDLIIMPNSAINEVSIGGYGRGIKSLKIYNYMGNLIFAGLEDHIPISTFSQGYYFIVVQLMDSKIKTGGFVKL